MAEAEIFNFDLLNSDSPARGEDGLVEITPELRSELQAFALTNYLLPEEGLADREEELRKRYGLTKMQYAGVKAYFTIYSNKIIKARGWEDSISALLFCFVYAFAKQVSPCPDLEAITVEDLDPIASGILGHAGIEFESFREALLEFESALLNQGNSEKILRIRERFIGSKAHGDLVNYGFRIKVRFRELWETFLKVHTTERMLLEPAAVCLPSRYPERDIGIFRRVNIPNGRILGVEGGSPQARFECGYRCAMMGVTTVASRLNLAARVAKHYGIRFSHVGLDLVSPFCQEVQNTIPLIQLQPVALVMINYLARRETKIATEHLRFRTKQLRTREIRDDVREKFRKLQLSKYYWQQQNALLTEFRSRVEALEVEEFSVSELRSGIVDYLLLQYFNSYKHCAPAFSSQFEKLSKLGISDPIDLYGVMQHIEGRIQDRVCGCAFAEASEDLLHAFQWAPELACDAATGAPKIVRAQKYFYRSEVGRNGSPFFSIMAEVHTPGSPLVDYDEWRHTARFFLDTAVAEVEAKVNEQKPPIVQFTSRGRVVEGEIPVPDIDLIRMVRQDGSVIAEMRYRRLVKDAHSYQDWSKRFPLNSYQAIRNLERSEIALDWVN